MPELVASAVSGRVSRNWAYTESVLRLIFCLGMVASSILADTVFLFSLDGFGHAQFQKQPIATLARLARQGAMADGIQPAFPSTTANSHAALWTGVYGDRNNISANSQPLLPRAAHSFLERNNGFLSTQLAAEPVWLAAARQGVKAVAYQAPQVFPFSPASTHPNVVAMNGYQTRQVAGHLILRKKDLQFTSPTAFAFRHGPLTFHGELGKKGLVIEGVPVPMMAADAPLRGDTAQRALARRFSRGHFLTQPVPAVVYFRLFAYTAEDLLLYVSPVQELAVSQGEIGPMLREAGGFIGNTYDGPLLNEAQSLETAELVARQNIRHTRWLVKQHRPGLFVGYLPIADEIGHHFLGRSLQNDAAAQMAYAWGFQIVDRWVKEMLQLVKAKDHVIFTSDHGMAPTFKLVNVNEILRRAGLGKQAVHVYNSVLLNTKDFKGGEVEDRAALRSRVQAALSAVGDPDPIFTGFYTPEEHGKQYGIGGPTASDLYFDMKVGYSVRDTVGEIFPHLESPGGNHGFRPDREDMLAILVAHGRKIPKGTRWPRLKSIDVAPLACQLLGISPPAQAQGKSPLP